MSGKVILSGFIRVPLDELETVTAALVEHTRLTLAEPGCLVFTVTPRSAEPGIFDLYEEFKDQAAFAAHQLRAKQSPWGAASANVERHFTVTHTGGNEG